MAGLLLMHSCKRRKSKLRSKMPENEMLWKEYLAKENENTVWAESAPELRKRQSA
jgi:predicted SAM-dependent methyltransferase